jgi:hypothetical protein
VEIVSKIRAREKGGGDSGFFKIRHAVFQRDADHFIKRCGSCSKEMRISLKRDAVHFTGASACVYVAGNAAVKSDIGICNGLRAGSRRIWEHI